MGPGQQSEILQCSVSRTWRERFDDRVVEFHHRKDVAKREYIVWIHIAGAVPSGDIPWGDAHGVEERYVRYNCMKRMADSFAARLEEGLRARKEGHLGVESSTTQRVHE